METEKYLNDDDVFTNGDWEGENLEDVADEVPEFLEWLLVKDTLEYDERERIQLALDKATTQLTRTTKPDTNTT